MTLIDMVARFGEIDSAATIYAVRPWSCAATAVVAAEPEEGGSPAEARAMGAAYFIEVCIARDFLDDWAAGLGRPTSAKERCGRLIRYAIDDA